jgi:replicative DNA helicase
MEEQEKQFIKSQLESYLQHSLGINTRRKFKCLNPEHEDRHPSMSYDRKANRVHCFSCKASYDIFDIIGINYGLTDHKSIFAKAMELFPSPSSTSPGQKSRPGASSQATEGNSRDTIDFTAYFLECQQRLGETDYVQRRGISMGIASRFGLGYDPNYTHGTGGKVWQALIIPTGPKSFVARNTAADAKPEDRYRKIGKAKLLNEDVLENSEKPIFLVEGEIDAMSILEVDGEAIGLGSFSGLKTLTNILKITRPKQAFLLALDKDDPGRTETDKILPELKEMGITVVAVDISGDYKDANEALVADREAFSLAVREAERQGDEIMNVEKREYLDTSVLSHICSFWEEINQRKGSPAISTGFKVLDECLEGGLFEGLYITGGISAVGKTTFILQMADQIARAGGDVLIFSLEMARTELMAKSISRHTALISINKGKKTELAKTHRGITDGSRYGQYSDAERQCIMQASDSYETYAHRIFIHEAMGDIGVKQVREHIERHFFFTGQYPVVFIDYLQVLAPLEGRLTDKQQVDRAVLELKRTSRDFKIPVICLSSFNRENYKEKVNMSAFKESGAIEYSSDVLIGLQLKGAGVEKFDVEEAMRRYPREVELVILKNRNGPSHKKISCDFYPKFNYFAEMKECK